MRVLRSLQALMAATMLALVLPAIASAAARYASPSPGPAATCQAGDPCSLQEAVEGLGVSDGDTVVVLPGTYEETSDLRVTDAITVAGSFTPQLDFSGLAGNAILVDDPGAVVRDLTVEQVAGTGALNISSGTVERVRVKSTGLNACELSGSSVAAATLRDSTCWSTNAFGKGVAASANAPAQAGGTLRNVTAFAPAANGFGVSAVAAGGEAARIDARNVIAIGGGQDVRAMVDATSTAAVDLASSNYSAVSTTGGPAATVTAAGTDGNQTSEPLLTNPAAGQFDQLPGSPTIDAGTPYDSIGPLDVNTDPRIQNVVPDIGADEFPDGVPPQTMIDSGPSGATPLGRPTFTFSASEPGSTFACQVDDDPFDACTSPQLTESLTQGPHTFRVRARDGAGNVDPSPAERTFTVDRSVGGANVSAKRVQRQRGGRVVLRIVAQASENVRVSSRGKIKAGRESFAVSSRPATLPNGMRRMLTLTPKKKAASKKILTALRHEKRAAAILTATFVDDFGNEATSGTVAVELKAR